MKTRSLKFKIHAAIVAACLVVCVFFGAVFVSLEILRVDSRLQEINTLLHAVYEQNREEIANEIFARHTHALRSTADRIMQISGIIGMAIFDTQGKTILVTTRYTPTSPSAVERARLNAKPSFRKTLLGGKAAAEYATAIEVIGERVGYIKLYYNLEELNMETLRMGITFLALLATTLLLLFFLLNRIMTRAIIIPTTQLRNAIHKLQLGGYGEQVAIESFDEIGEVAQAFNDLSVQLMEKHRALEQSLKTQQRYAHELKEANRNLEQLNAKLEDMVQERTRELVSSNEQLKREIAERKRAEEARHELEDRLARAEKMEALGLLAGGVAHDLNNVLSGIVSYPDMLLMGLPDGSPLKKPIQIIRDSGQKAAAIVQDLLTLARRGVVNMQPTDLNKEIVEYLDSPEHARILERHDGVTLVLDLEDGLFPVNASPIHLRKTVMNLVINAMEAMPEGGTIRISTRNIFVDKPIEGYDTVNPGDYVVLAIEDTGVGIDPKDIHRIFEPFYSKKVMGRSGTGLGMAVVWGTVQDHGGYITVRSRPSQGTCFELFFPACRQDMELPTDTMKHVDYTGNGELIVVVDDLEQQRQIATDILTRLGYTALSCPSGEDAVEFLKANKADCVLLDMIMEPGMDGLDTYRRIIEIHPGQKAIIASGYAENERVEEAIRLGVSFFIKKPYTIENLALAIKTCLSVSG